MNVLALDCVWMFLTYEIESDYNSLTKMSPKAIFTRDPQKSHYNQMYLFFGTFLALIFPSQMTMTEWQNTINILLNLFLLSIITYNCNTFLNYYNFFMLISLFTTQHVNIFLREIQRTCRLVVHDLFWIIVFLLLLYLHSSHPTDQL